MAITLQEYLTLFYDDARNLSLIQEYNRELTSKYPWLLPKEFLTKNTPKDYDYRYTRLDAMPDGWRLAFGDNMCQEIQRELVKFDAVGAYNVYSIKEHNGILIWIDNALEINKLGVYDKTTYTKKPIRPDYRMGIDYWKFNGVINGMYRYDHYPVVKTSDICNIVDKYQELSQTIKY